MDKFRDRQEAGMVLAEHLKEYKNRSDIIVLALPRGGVPVGYEIAKALGVPLDVFIVRKLGVPGQEELAMGAVAMGNVTVLNEGIISGLGIKKNQIDEVLHSEQQELQRRQLAYRGNRPYPSLQDKTIILVDDGIATGATMRAAVSALRQLKSVKIIVAVPVSSIETYDHLSGLVDKMVCPMKPHFFQAVGEWYQDFSQTTDAEVTDLLQKTTTLGQDHP